MKRITILAFVLLVTFLISACGISKDEAMTKLMLAAKTKCEQVKSLLKEFPDLINEHKKGDFGHTPLISAAYSGQL